MPHDDWYFGWPHLTLKWLAVHCWRAFIALALISDHLMSLGVALDQSDFEESVGGSHRIQDSYKPVFEFRIALARICSWHGQCPRFGAS